MRKVQRSEIVDYQTYSEQREEVRKKAMIQKDLRRIHVGPVLTFLFESTDTIRYQIQEMMRAEQMVKESEILHEIETYNDLLGESGELGCTLLIEIENPAERAQKLEDWVEMPKHLYIKTDANQKIYASFDKRQLDEKRLSSVQYLKFKIGQQKPISIGCDLHGYKNEYTLTEEQSQILLNDLK